MTTNAPPTRDNAVIGTDNQQFPAFLASIPQVDLPIRIRGCEIPDEDFSEVDTELSNPFTEDDMYVIGQIQSNGDYVSVLTLGEADCMLPVLNTFTFEGKPISRETIAIGYCGADPCFACTETMVLTADFSIYTADTIITTECDDNYQPIPGTEKIEVVYREGTLTELGSIELSEELRKIVEP